MFVNLKSRDHFGSGLDIVQTTDHILGQQFNNLKNLFKYLDCPRNGGI